MWHVMWQRTRGARRWNKEERVNVERDREAMAEEDSWEQLKTWKSKLCCRIWG